MNAQTVPPVVKITHLAFHTHEDGTNHRVSINAVGPDGQTAQLVGEYPSPTVAAKWLERYSYRYVPASNGLWYRKDENK